VTTLIEFLEARLAEDEQIARNASMPLVGGDREVWAYDREAFAVRATHGRWNVATRRDDPSDSAPISIGDAYGEYIAANQPARVLREVAAKRAILADIVPAMNGADEQINSEWGVGPMDPADYESVELLRLLALPYSDHPDFDPNWSTT
jgi:hypothetical protein